MKLRRPSRRTSIVVAVVAFLVAAGFGVKAVVEFVQSIDGPTLAAPGTTYVHIGPGRWMILEATDIGRTIDVSNVNVRDAHELRIPVRNVTGDQTISTKGDRYVGVVEFTAPTEGDYAIQINNGFHADVLLNRPVTDVIRSVALWGIATFLSFAVFVLFLVLAIVPARPAGAAPAMPPRVPPGWYPDPAPETGLVRWWDGYRWTEHTNPR